MMSNVLEHKGEKNTLLGQWVNKKGYKVISYNKSARKGRKEVLIVNYNRENI